MIEREKVISLIKAQIAICKEIDSDFISLTVGTGKRILELLDEAGEEEPEDYENGFHDGYQQAMKDVNGIKITRCLDCVYAHRRERDGAYHCNLYGIWKKDGAFFCADGEPTQTNTQNSALDMR